MAQKDVAAPAEALPHNITGLTDAEVRQRVQRGQYNAQPAGTTSTVGKICLKNIANLFNFICFSLFVIILIVGEAKDTLFVFVPIINTLMGIVQELRAKRALDKLSILVASKVTAVRDGQPVEIDQQDVVLDDIVLLTAGNQICADGRVVVSENMEVNEALLTGEADNIQKQPGDKVMSGSFVVAGRAYAQITAVGSGSFATALTLEAKQSKKKTTPLMRILNGIIRTVAIIIVPVGGFLFYTQYTENLLKFEPGEAFRISVLSSSTAVLGMIPDGLVLLTGITLTLGALKLARRKALVQSLPCIETLARVDMLCLDKTGTITDGTLSFRQFIPREGFTQEQAGRIIGELMAALPDDNATAAAMRDRFGSRGSWNALVKVPFSSARKWSGVTFRGEGSYIIGAPSFVFPSGKEPFFKTVDKYASAGYRVICLAHGDGELANQTLPSKVTCLALLVFADNIRPEAPETFRYFADEGVTLKVISGDDPATVSTVAAKAGIDNADLFVDMSKQDEHCDFYTLAAQYTVFGRVSPHQKRELIRALKRHGHTTCMTGDGVNDVLAMKESDCSIAMVGGSSAARNASDFVLMSSDFSAMIKVMQEGRRVINNMEGVACLYLVRTFYSTMIALLFGFFTFPYFPFETPLQLMPITTFTVGIPSFFLALRKNTSKPKGRFMAAMVENALVAAVVVILNIMIIQVAGTWFNAEMPVAGALHRVEILSWLDIATMNVLLTGSVGFAMLYKISKPHTLPIKLMIGLCAIGYALSLVIFYQPLNLGTLFSRNVFFYLPLLISSMWVFFQLSRLTGKLLSRVQIRIVRNDR